MIYGKNRTPTHLCARRWKEHFADENIQATNIVHRAIAKAAVALAAATATAHALNTNTELTVAEQHFRATQIRERATGKGSLYYCTYIFMAREALSSSLVQIFTSAVQLHWWWWSSEWARTSWRVFKPCSTFGVVHFALSHSLSGRKTSRKCCT